MAVKMRVHRHRQRVLSRLASRASAIEAALNDWHRYCDKLRDEIFAANLARLKRVYGV